MNFVHFLSYCLVLALYIDSNTGLNYKGISCRAEGICRCIFPDGQGIDLTTLKESCGYSKDPDYTLIFQPCSSNITNSSNPCFNSAVCLKVNETKFISLGSASEGRLEIASIRDVPKITFVTTDIGNPTLTTTVTLECDPTATEPFLEYSSNEDVYEVTLRSREGCIRKLHLGTPTGGGGMSVWSVLLLVALILAIVYFVGGVLVLKCIRGAEGIEMIPNHAFWISIPSRLRNSLVFCANGCKSPSTYDRI